MNIISELIDEKGLSALAAEVGVSYQAVRKWERQVVPPERVITVSRVSGWKFTPHMIRPDLYPHHEDGLPPDLRGQDRAA